MEIYNKLKSLLEDVIPYQNSNVLGIILKQTNYLEEFKVSVISNPEKSLPILNRYYNVTQTFIESGEPLENLLFFWENKLITNIDTEEKKTFNLIDNMIYEYLQQVNFFQIRYEECNCMNVMITKQDIIDYKKLNPSEIINVEKFEYRKNQLEVLNHLERNGLITGIHCEATGCGKSIEILMYIDWTFKKNNKCKIILFTERVNILADLFDFENNSQNIQVWKNKGICDLTNFKIIDRVTVKKSDWVSLLNINTGPILLVINRAYLTTTTEYEKILKLDLILHDECHNVSSNKCFEFLKYFKSKNNIPIVGFSATPMRAGKTKSGDNLIFNKDRLLDIYGIDKQLNIITNYNMVYAIGEQLILPPKFYWFNIDNYQIKNNKEKIKELISKSEIGSVMKILDELIPFMPNKKLIAWCGTIPLCDIWYNKFLEYKEMYENLKNIKIYKDYSKKISNSQILGYSVFKNIESNGIMFCAQKHREGSDIYKLDGCIFLDKVKNRSPIPFIQSIGRVLRKDKSLNKTNGFIIDGVVRDDEDYEKNIVDKILGYYFALEDLANLDDLETDTNTNYSKYMELRDLVEFDLDEKKIKLKLNKTLIEINCKKLDWANIVDNFDSILGKKIGLNNELKLKLEFENIKKIIKKKKFLTMGDYYKWATRKNILDDPKIKYQKYWINSYDFLSIDTTHFINKSQFKQICIQHKITKISQIDKIIKKYNNIPSDPCEFYNIKNFKHFINIEEQELI